MKNLNRIIDGVKWFLSNYSMPDTHRDSEAFVVWENAIWANKRLLEMISKLEAIVDLLQKENPACPCCSSYKAYTELVGEVIKIVEKE